MIFIAIIVIVLIVVIYSALQPESLGIFDEDKHLNEIMQLPNQKARQKYIKAEAKKRNNSSK